MGTTGAHHSIHQTSRDYGQDGAVDGLGRSTPLHADDTDTRTQASRSGPTRQSYARDSEPDYSLMSDEARAEYDAQL